MENATTLNDLIEINNDRVEGYGKAIKEVKDSDLHVIFESMIGQSRQFLIELKELVRIEGEQPADGTTIRGKIYRVWMDVKAAFSGNDRQTVLNSCEFGEDAAQRAYAAALEEDLTPEVKALVEKQKLSLKASHDKIKTIRDRKLVV